MSSEPNNGASASNPVFERKVRWSRAALLLERMWPRVWLLIGLVALFLVLTFAGAWSYLPDAGHIAALGVFGLAALASLIWIARTPAASRAEAIRRIELQSGVRHRPASSYEDTLTASATDPAATSLWQAHKARLAEQINRLRVAQPRARTDRLDPFAVRGLLLAAVGVTLWMVGDSASDRLRAAFRIGPPELSANARLDAWVTPPAYTSIAPIILADGARPAGQAVAAAGGWGDRGSRAAKLVVRASGAGAKGSRLKSRKKARAQRGEVKPEDPAKKSRRGRAQSQRGAGAGQP
ncbi:MAG: DUF4175 family protein [Hyphomicrobiaceae bacterium]